MNTDPTSAEMLAVLEQTYPEHSSDYEEAIYWFANRYHVGQTSNLYSVLSTSEFDPGPVYTFDDASTEVRKMYLLLKTQFTTSISPR